MASSQGSARSRKDQPVLITDAQPSLQEEHAARKRRYVLTMAVRALSLILATVVYASTHLLWLALGLAALSTVLPWIAVVMANDGPPKSKRYVNHYRPERTLENPAPRAIEGSRIIDG